VKRNVKTEAVLTYKTSKLRNYSFEGDAKVKLEEPKTDIIFVRLSLCLGLLLFVTFVGCSNSPQTVLNVERTLCSDCGRVMKTDSTITSYSGDDWKWVESQFKYAKVSDERFSHFRVISKSSRCDSCDKIKIDKEKREEAEIDRKTAQMKRQVKARGWMEILSIFPVDYQAHFELRNLTPHTIKVEYEVSCLNTYTPSTFFAYASFENVLQPYETVHLAWHPDEAIDELRSAIVAKGADMTADEIKGLKAEYFDVSVEFKSTLTQ